VGLGLALGGGCKHASPALAPPARPASARPALAVLPAGAHSYELSLEQGKDPARDRPSDPPRWRFQVRLVKGGQVLDQVSPFAMACGEEVERSPVRRVFGADPESQAWGTSGEHCDIVLAVRTAELAPGVIALLVSQRLGYESVYAQHWLLRPIDGRLGVAWESGGGPNHFPGVRVLPTNTPRRSDLAFTLIEAPSDGEATVIQAARMVFDPVSGEMKKTPLPDAQSPLFVVTVGSFPTAAAAQQAWSRDRDCLFWYSVFRASLLPGLRARDHLLGRVLALRQDADSAASELARCSQISKATVLEYPAAR